MVHLLSRIVNCFLQRGDPLQSASVAVGLELVHLNPKCHTQRKENSSRKPSGLHGGKICEASA